MSDEEHKYNTQLIEILNEMEKDCEHSKNMLQLKREERIKLDADIKYYEGICDGSNFSIEILKRRVPEDK